MEHRVRQQQGTGFFTVERKMSRSWKVMAVCGTLKEAEDIFNALRKGLVKTVLEFQGERHELNQQSI